MELQFFVKVMTFLLFSENQVKGLDEDESHFLDFVSQRQADIDKKRENENEMVLQEYRVC